MRFPRRFEPQADFIRLQIANAGHFRTRDLVIQISGQAVTSNSHYVLGRPFGGLVVQFLEFEWHALRVLFEPVNVSVYACHETPRSLLGIFAVGQPLAGHIAAVDKQASGFILLNESWPKCFREPAQSAPAPK